MLDPSVCFNGKMGNKNVWGRCVSLKLLKTHMNVGKEANCPAFLLDILGDVPPSIFIVPMGRVWKLGAFDPTVVFEKT